MICVIATTPMKPENKDDCIRGHKPCTAETLKEKGCISYDGHVSVNNPNLYVVVERWETRDDLNAHGRAPHMKVWRGYLSQMKTAPAVIEIISDGKVGKFLRGFLQARKNPPIKILGPHRWTHAAAGTLLVEFDDRHPPRIAAIG